MSDHNCHEQKNLRPRGLRICSKYLCRSWQSFCALHTEQCFDCKNPNMEMTPALHIWDRVGASESEVVGGRSRRWRGGWRGVGGWVAGGSWQQYVSGASHTAMAMFRAESLRKWIVSFFMGLSSTIAVLLPITEHEKHCRSASLTAHLAWAFQALSQCFCPLWGMRSTVAVLLLCPLWSMRSTIAVLHCPVLLAGLLPHSGPD